MRIAILSDTFLPQINGVSKTLSKMKEYMDDEGIEYRFIVPRDGDYTEKNVINMPSIPLVIYPECKITICGYRKLRKQLDSFKPDIIHMITPFSMGLLGLLYCRKRNIPVVSSYHTDFPKYMKYYKLDFLVGTMWKYLRWFYSHSIINFCPSHDTKTILNDNGIKNLELWGRGVDTDIYRPENKKLNLRSKYCEDYEAMLLYVGRVAEEKEIEVLIKSCEILNLMGAPYKLVVVGDGPYLRKLRDRNIKNIEYVGYKSGDKLRSYYASADIFTFPSSSETYGNVILEAMASGLPVIAPYAGGLKENLLSGYNGLSFKQGSIKDMSDKIFRLINNMDTRNRMGKNARTYTEQKNWKDVFDRLFNRYEDVIDKNSK